MPEAPSYDGSGLVNLVGEIELRLTGEAPFPGLARADLVPDANTYVMVLFDGLGVAQLEHPSASVLRGSLVATLEAPFPTTTSVSLATVATGLSPSHHGQVGHLTWYPELGEVVNSLKWVTIPGGPVAYDYASLLPRPNLWERLRAAGIEPITVQPGDFTGSPLSRSTYRGARFEGAWTVDEMVSATRQLASQPGRFVFTYVPFVDVAGHVFGQASPEFTTAMRHAAAIWDGILAGLDSATAVIGTADHGLIEVIERDKVLVRDERFDRLRFAGDPRGVQLWGDRTLIAELADVTSGALTDPLPLLGPSSTEQTRSRVGERLLLAPEGKVILPKGFDKRLRCYHGGLTPEEVVVPLLVG